MDHSRLAIGLAAGMIVLGALVACDSASGVVDQAAPAGTSAAPPASRVQPTIASAQPQPTATDTAGAQPANPQPAAKSAATATKSAAVQSKPPTPTVAPAAASGAKTQGDALEQQLDQLLNGLDHTDTVDDASK